MLSQRQTLHQMASVQVLKSALLTPVSISRSNFPGKSRESDSGKRVLTLTTCRSSRRYFVGNNKKFIVRCAVQENNDQTNGEEPPESLFMKELKKRGMNPTSLLEDAKRGNLGVDEDTKVREKDGGFSKRNAVTTDVEQSLSNQRERSMALNSEGLEGLIPRAKLLLRIGGTFFLGFWPLIAITVALFSGLYLYFGPTFIHDASNAPRSLPQYTDPYALLEDERITQIAPRVN